MEIKVKKLSYEELEQGYKNILNRLSKCEKKLDKIKKLMIEYKYTNIEDYSRIMEFYRKLEKLLEEIE